MLHRNYRRFWGAMLLSNIGTWMQNIVQPWLAYSLTGSGLLLGLVGAVQFAPALFLSFFAGAYLDRFQKRKVILLTQSLLILVTGILTVLVFTKQLRYPHILALAFCMGLINTFDMPARQSFLVQMVGRKDLMNAVALNMSMFNVARIIGPVLASILIASVGIGYCLLYNSLSFGIVVLVLLGMNDVPREVILPNAFLKGGLRHEVKQGLLYLYRNQTLFIVIVSSAILGIFAYNFSVLVPVYASRVLGKGERGFALLMSMMGVGSFSGALFMAVRSRHGLKPSRIPFVGIVVGVLLFLTGMCRNFATASFFLAVTGFATVMFGSMSQSILQIQVEDGYRGRVMSVHSFVNMGSTPLGNLFAGLLLDRTTVPATFAVLGSVIILSFLIIIFAARGKFETVRLHAECVRSGRLPADG